MLFLTIKYMMCFSAQPSTIRTLIFRVLEAVIEYQKTGCSTLYCILFITDKFFESVQEYPCQQDKNYNPESVKEKSR